MDKPFAENDYKNILILEGRVGKKLDLHLIRSSHDHDLHKLSTQDEWGRGPMCLLGPLEPLRLSNAKGIKPPMTSFEPLSPNSVKLQESHAAVLPCSSAAWLPCFSAAMLLFYHAAIHIVLPLSKPNIQEAIPNTFLSCKSSPFCHYPNQTLEKGVQI